MKAFPDPANVAGLYCVGEVALGDRYCVRVCLRGVVTIDPYAGTLESKPAAAYSVKEAEHPHQRFYGTLMSSGKSRQQGTVPVLMSRSMISVIRLTSS